MRFTRTGALDTGFGQEGVSTFFFTEGGQVLAADASVILIQPDGRIVVAGTAGHGDSSITRSGVVYRLNADGSLDLTFGRGGLAPRLNPALQDIPVDVALDTQGRIILLSASRRGYQQNTVVARYTPEGELDPSFSGDGYRHFSLGGRELNVQSLRTGKILIFGSLGLVRLRADGRFDRAFGPAGDGVVLAGVPNFYGQTGLVQPGGGLLLAGSVDGWSLQGAAVVRFHADGTLDDSFGQGGLVLLSFHDGGYDWASEIALAADGAIILSGSVGATDSRSDFGVAVLNPNGSLRRSFGDGGLVVISPFPAPYSYDDVTAMAIQLNGKIVVAGSADQYEQVLVRFLT